MLYKKITVLALAGLLVFAGCQKDKTGGSDPKSTWTIEGVTYTGTNPASYSTTSNSLSASDNTLNGDIEIQFSTKPTMDGSFPVTDLGDTSALINSSNCSILVNTPSTSHYRSSGSHQVTVTVGTGGKLTATFSGMLMKSGASSSTLSGTIIEK